MTHQTTSENKCPLKVLIAEDEHLIATYLASNIADLGYEVIGPANNGETAVKLCKEHSPDLALLDIQMPKLDGIEAASLLFQENKTPTVILSAYADPEYVEAGNKIGIFGYLLKPVSRSAQVGIEVAWAKRYLDWSAKHEQEELQERLVQRKLIEQAKWIIVKRKQVDEPEAMRMLQKQARNNRKPLINVAQAIVDSEDLLGD